MGMNGRGRGAADLPIYMCIVFSLLYFVNKLNQCDMWPSMPTAWRLYACASIILFRTLNRHIDWYSVYRYWVFWAFLVFLLNSIVIILMWMPMVGTAAVQYGDHVGRFEYVFCVPCRRLMFTLTRYIECVHGVPIAIDISKYRNIEIYMW